MAFDDLFANGKPYPRPGVVFFAMQSLENNEYAVVILRVYSDTIVADGEYPLILFFLRRNMYTRRRLAAEFKGVANKILK